MRDKNKTARFNALPNPFKRSSTEPSLEAISDAGKSFENIVVNGGSRKPEVPIGIAVRMKALLEEGGWIVAADMASAALNKGNAVFHVASPEHDPKAWTDHVKDLKEQIEAAERDADKGAETESTT